MATEKTVLYLLQTLESYWKKNCISMNFTAIGNYFEIRTVSFHIVWKRSKGKNLRISCCSIINFAILGLYLGFIANLKKKYDIFLKYIKNCWNWKYIFLPSKTTSMWRWFKSRFLDFVRDYFCKIVTCRKFRLGFLVLCFYVFFFVLCYIIVEENSNKYNKKI